MFEERLLGYPTSNDSRLLDCPTSNDLISGGRLLGCANFNNLMCEEMLLSYPTTDDLKWIIPHPLKKIAKIRLKNVFINFKFPKNVV